MQFGSIFRRTVRGVQPAGSTVSRGFKRRIQAHILLEKFAWGAQSEQLNRILKAQRPDPESEG
jgi:hypothetical protein